MPLQSSERALQALSEALDDGRSPLLLDGVGGVGKTMLLRVLGERERRRGRRVVFSPFLHLPPEDVARWLLHLLNQTFPASQPADAALLADVRRSGARTVVLVDEVQCTPEASLRRLAELAREGAPQLVVVAAATLGPKLDALLSVLRPERRVTLPSALRACEMEALCDAILAHPALPRGLRELSRAARDAILRDARGLPSALTAELVRRLHQAGAPDEGALSAADTAAWRELGAPAGAHLHAADPGEADLARGVALAREAEGGRKADVVRARPSELDELGALRAARAAQPRAGDAGAVAPAAAAPPAGADAGVRTGPSSLDLRRPPASAASPLDLRRPPASAASPAPVQRRPLRARSVAPPPAPGAAPAALAAPGAAQRPGPSARAGRAARAGMRARVARAAALPAAAGRDVRRAGRSLARSLRGGFARLAAALRAGGAAASAALVALGVALAAGPRRAGRAAASAGRGARGALARGADGLGARSRAWARGLGAARGTCGRALGASAGAARRTGASARSAGARSLRAAVTPFAWTASAGAGSLRAAGAGAGHAAATAASAGRELRRALAARARAAGGALTRVLCAIGRAEERLALRAWGALRAAGAGIAGAGRAAGSAVRATGAGMHAALHASRGYGRRGVASAAGATRAVARGVGTRTRRGCASAAAALAGAAHATAGAGRSLAPRLAPLASGRAFAIALAVVLELGMLWMYASAPAAPPRAERAAPPAVAAGPGPAAALALASAEVAAAREAPAAQAAEAAPVRVHVNARPWARIRVDGVDVGPTPLSHVHLPPGPHAFEAAFPDGRRVERVVEITSEQRFVALH